jgi:Fn3 associated
VFALYNNNNNSIIAKALPPDADGASTILGVETTNANTLQCTIKGLQGTVDYEVEVRGRNTEGALSLPLAASNAGGTLSPAGAPTSEEVLTPSVNFDADTNTFTITSTSTVEVYYTLDGTKPVTGDSIFATAFLYKGPFALTVADVKDATSITITVAAISKNSFVSDQIPTTFPIIKRPEATSAPTLPAPEPPTVSAAPGSGSIIVTAVPKAGSGTARLRITVSG